MTIRFRLAALGLGLALCQFPPARAEEATPAEAQPPAATARPPLARPGAIPFTLWPPPGAGTQGPQPAVSTAPVQGPPVPAKAVPGSIAPRPPSPPSAIQLSPPQVRPPASTTPVQVPAGPRPHVIAQPVRPVSSSPGQPAAPIFPAHPTPQDRFLRNGSQQQQQPTLPKMPIVARPKKPVLYPFQQPSAPFNQPLGRPLPDEVNAATAIPPLPRPAILPKAPVAPVAPAPPVKEKAAKKADCLKGTSGCTP